LARLAQLTVDLRSDAVATKALRGILEIADAFAGFLADPQARQEARDIGVINMVDEQDSTFARMRKRSGELQQHLECLFLDSPTLGSLGRKYMTF
jgi:hypothetical protein